MLKKSKIIIPLLIFAIVCASAFIFVNKLQQREDAENTKNSESADALDYFRVRYDGAWYKENPNLTTLLIIGVDSFDIKEEHSKQCDSLVLVLMNEEDGTYKTLQLNRDTMADVPQLDMNWQEYGTKNQQIALAYSHSDSDAINAQNTVKAVSNLLYGIDVDHFIVLGMDAVPMINDLVGGVPVTIEDDFTNVDPSLIQGETITLNGQQALHFVRARSEMAEPTNIARMARQRAYIQALHKAAKEKAEEDSDFIMRSLFEISSYIDSDCSITQLTKFFNIALECEPPDILTTKGEAQTSGEYNEYILDEDALQQQVIDLFFIPDDSEHSL